DVEILIPVVAADEHARVGAERVVNVSNDAHRVLLPVGSLPLARPEGQYYLVCRSIGTWMARALRGRASRSSSIAGRQQHRPPIQAPSSAHSISTRPPELASVRAGPRSAVPGGGYHLCLVTEAARPGPEPASFRQRRFEPPPGAVELVLVRHGESEAY